MPAGKNAKSRKSKVTPFPGLHVVTAKGKTYAYAWRGGPRIHSDYGTPEFSAEYVAAHAKRKKGDATSISGLCVTWKASDAWKGLSASTKRNWIIWLGRIEDHFGDLSLKQFDRPEIRQDIKRWRNKWAKSPRAADMGKQVLSALLSFAVEEGRLRSNPCFGISNLYKADRSSRIWTEEALERMEATASQEIVWALKLACATGLRRADLLALSWSHIGANCIEIPTAKSGRKRSALIPLYDDLRAFLAEIPKRSTTVLTNSMGRPWGTGFSSSWNKAIKKAGITDLHFHDARGTFATWLYRKKVHIREIADALGWSEHKVDRLIQRYVARDATMAKRANALDSEPLGNLAVKPAVKPGRPEGRKAWSG